MNEGMQEMMDRAAEELLAIPLALQDAAKFLPHPLLIAWLQYYAQWLDALHEVLQFKLPKEKTGSWRDECSKLRDVVDIHTRLSGNPGLLRDVDAAFHTRYEFSEETIKLWKEEAYQMTAALNPFSAFLETA
jgi:hypothetical protein